MDVDPYKVLQVPRNANSETIKNAYHAKARSTHPDKCTTDDTSAADSFLQLQSAYSLLIDPECRKTYDTAYKLKQNKQKSATPIEELFQQAQPAEDGVQLFNCRCGEEIEVYEDDEELIECPGCSLVYDTRNK